MAVPTGFTHENVVLAAPPGLEMAGISSLSVHKTVDPVTQLPMAVTCWKMTKSEVDTVTRTGRVWVSLLGPTIPPLLVTGVSPFTNTGEIKEELDTVEEVDDAKSQADRIQRTLLFLDSQEQGFLATAEDDDQPKPWRDTCVKIAAILAETRLSLAQVK